MRKFPCHVSLQRPFPNSPASSVTNELLTKNVLSFILSFVEGLFSEAFFEK